MSYLTLVKSIMNDELTNEELIDCLSIPNVPVIQHTILKVIERKICNPNVLCKLLEYTEEFQTLYESLSDEGKEQVMILEKAFF